MIVIRILDPVLNPEHSKSLLDWSFARDTPPFSVYHKMTQIFVKYILHLCIFRHLKLEIALAIPASNDEK